MIHKLSLKLLAGIEKLPSFYSYVKEHKEKVNLSESVELSREEWSEIKDDFKGVYNGIPHYIDLQESVLKMVPVTGTWLHKQEAFEDKTGGPPNVEGDNFEEKKNATTKEPSTNNFADMDATGKATTKEACPASDAAKDGTKSKEQAQSEKEHSDPKSTSYDQASENNKDKEPKEASPATDAPAHVKEATGYEKGKEVNITADNHPLKGRKGVISEVGNGYYTLDLGKDGSITAKHNEVSAPAAVTNESAEEKAKSIIASVYSKNRKTTADAGNQNADAGTHENELDSFASDIKDECDMNDHKADKMKGSVDEFHDSSESNPKWNGEGGKGAKESDKKKAASKKPSFDNFAKMAKKDAIHGNALEEALKFLEMIHPDMIDAAKKEKVASKEVSKNPFGKKKSQKSK